MSLLQVATLFNRLNINLKKKTRKNIILNLYFQSSPNNKTV